MEQSILISIKKLLDLAPDYDAFDPNIMMFVNAVFSEISQLGVGPPGGFSIEDDSSVWSSLEIPDNQLQLVKTLVFLKVRLMFDPPPTSFAIEALNKQIDEQMWRLSIFREGLVPVKTITTVVDPMDGSIDTTTTEEVVTW